MLTVLRIDNQRQLAKRRQMATDLESLNAEIKSRMEAYLEVAKSPGPPTNGAIDEKLIALVQQEDELKQMQIQSNTMSIELERMDLAEPSWIERAKSVIAQRLGSEGRRDANEVRNE